MIKLLKRKWDLLSPGVKASLAFFIAGLVSKGISYITTPLYTRLLTSEEFGQISVYMTWKDIIGIIAMFSLSMGIFNNGMVNYPNQRDEYSFSMLGLSNVITVVTAIVFFFVYLIDRSLFSLDTKIWIMMFGSFLVYPAYNIWLARQRYELKYKLPILYSTILAVISPALAIGLMLSHPIGERLYARLYGSEIALIFAFIFFYIYLGKKSKWKVNQKYWKEAFLFNLPLIPHYLSTYLLNSSDKIMISRLVDNSATAFYSVAYSVAAVATLIWSSASGSLIPYTFEKCKTEDYKSISKVTIPILYIFAIGCCLVILFAPEVVSVMGPDEYKEAVYVIPPIVGGVFFQVQYHVFANVIYYFKKPKYVMYGSVISTILNLILNYIFIKKYGYIAAGYTTLFCFMIQAGIDYIALNHVVKKEVFSRIHIVSLSVCVLIIAIFSNLLYAFPSVRYCIIVITLIGLILNYKRIIALIRIH